MERLAKPELSGMFWIQAKESKESHLFVGFFNMSKVACKISGKIQDRG